jgi:ribonuclease E
MTRRKMLINARHPEEIRVALTDNNSLFDFDIDSKFHDSTTGNIYLATVSRVEVSLNAVFVDYGSKRHGFLPFKEIAPQYTGGREDNESIKANLKEGTRIIIQVNKDERGNKGAAVSSYISLAGCYLVLMPNNEKAGGISRRIEGEERQQLKDTLKNLNIPEGVGVIIRTAGLGRSPEELQWDLDALFKLWSAIEFEANNLSRKAPCLIYRESDAILRSVRDYLRQDIDEIIVDTESVHQEVLGHIRRLRPDFIDRLKKYTDERPLFSRYRIESQLESAHARQVDLPSGGALVIDHTEALTAIDINSAKSTKGGDIEETALRTNLEAAAEIARQARLRDLGGLIVIDFIDMLESSHQREVENALIQAFDSDRARVQFGRLSRFGLLEMSRQRLRPSLRETTDHPCPRCEGRGVIRAVESLTLSILRQIEDEVLHEKFDEIHLQLPLEVATFLLNEKRETLAHLENAHKIRIAVIPNPDFQTPHYTIKRHKKIDETRRSYDLRESRQEELSGAFVNEEAHQRETAVIKQIEVPEQPKPKKVGLLQRIFQDLFGDKKSESSAKSNTAQKASSAKKFDSSRSSHPKSRREGPREDRRNQPHTGNLNQGAPSSGKTSVETQTNTNNSDQNNTRRAPHNAQGGRHSRNNPNAQQSQSRQQNNQNNMIGNNEIQVQVQQAASPLTQDTTSQNANGNNNNKGNAGTGARNQNAGTKGKPTQPRNATHTQNASTKRPGNPSSGEPSNPNLPSNQNELVIRIPAATPIKASTPSTTKSATPAAPKTKALSVNAEDVLAKAASTKTVSKFKQAESKVKTESVAKIEILEVAHKTEFSLEAAKAELAKKKKPVKQVETSLK